MNTDHAALVSSLVSFLKRSSSSSSSWLAALALALGVSACKPSAEVSAEIPADGIYALVAVDGKPLPADVSHEGHALQIRSGAFTLNADGTCSSRMVFLPPSGTEANREVQATYQREGSLLTMQWKGAGRTAGTLAGRTFTMTNEGMVLRYEK